MKTLLLALLPILASAQETKVSESQIRFTPIITDSLMALTKEGQLVKVVLDPQTMVLDKTTTPWTIKVTVSGGGGGSVSGVYWEDVQPQWIVDSVRQWAWQTPGLTAANVFSVTRNGIAMRKNTDFTIGPGNLITFTAQQDSVSGDYINIKMLSTTPINLSEADVPKPVTAQQRGPGQGATMVALTQCCWAIDAYKKKDQVK